MIDAGDAKRRCTREDAPVFTNTTKFQRKDQQEMENSGTLKCARLGKPRRLLKIVAGQGPTRKSANFWASRPSGAHPLWSKNGRSRIWPKSKLAEVEKKSWPKSKLAEVDRARTRPCEGQCTEHVGPVTVAGHSHWGGFTPRSQEATWTREFRCPNVPAKSICTVVERRQRHRGTGG